MDQGYPYFEANRVQRRALAGLPVGLELPELENQLEAVSVSTAQVREIAGFRGAAGDLEAEARAVIWQGEASDRFRSKTTEVAQSFRNAVDNFDRSPGLAQQSVAHSVPSVFM